MKALILGAGYAVRLRPLTLKTAKPLLTIGGRPMIDYVVEKIDEIEEVDRIYVVANDRFFRDFEAWVEHAPTSKPVSLVNDGSTCADNRLGAVADVNFVVQKKDVNDDLLVVGGDNLFDFGLRDLVCFFEEKGTSVGLHSCEDPSDVKKYSSVKLDRTGRIVFFEEKPQTVSSNLVAICLYVFEKEALRLLKEYLQGGGNPDAPGHYIEWLHKQIAIYGKMLLGSWCDIGDEKTYREADRLFRRRAALPGG